MKIVNRAAFLALPAGTLFSKYEPCVFDALEIKGDSLPHDFFAQGIADAIDCHDCGEYGDKLQLAEEDGTSVALDLDCQYRDGCFDEHQLFAVWEPGDVRQLIQRLQAALKTTEAAR